MMIKKIAYQHDFTMTEILKELVDSILRGENVRQAVIRRVEKKKIEGVGGKNRIKRQAHLLQFEWRRHRRAHWLGVR